MSYSYNYLIYFIRNFGREQRDIILYRLQRIKTVIPESAMSHHFAHSDMIVGNFFYLIIIPVAIQSQSPRYQYLPQIHTGSSVFHIRSFRNYSFRNIGNLLTDSGITINMLQSRKQFRNFIPGSDFISEISCPSIFSCGFIVFRIRFPREDFGRRDDPVRKFFITDLLIKSLYALKFGHILS